MSPFAIQKGVTGIAGDGVAIKRSQNGIITLTCGKKSQSDNLLKCVSLGGLAPVTVSLHRSLNTCKGVIRNWELANCDPDEIKRNIPNIVEVHLIVSKRDGKEIKTNTLIFLYRKILLQKIIEKQNIKNTKNTKIIHRNYSTPPPPP